MKFPRFRIGTLLILVLLAGAGSGYALLWWRAREYRRLAEYYALEEAKQAAMGQQALSIAAMYQRRVDRGQIPAGDPRLRAASAEQQLAIRKRETYRRTKQQYERAARNPWLTVTPDPPRPE